MGDKGDTGEKGDIGDKGETGDAPTTADTLMYWNSGTVLPTGTTFLRYGSTTTTEPAAQIVIPADSLLNTMSVRLTVPPGGTASRTFTLRVNGANTPLTATISGNSNTAFVTLIVPVQLNQGDLVSLQQFSSTDTTPIASIGIVSVKYV